MAQTTEHQVNVTVTPITLTEFTEDVDVIQKLDDEPNDVGGLSAAELKEEFDKNGNAIKEYINEILLPEVIGADATEQARQEAENERVANELERVSNENTRIANETTRQTKEAARNVFETFDSTKAYAVGNKVAYNGSSYVCTVATTAGILPTNTSYWLLIAKAGTDGKVTDVYATVDNTRVSYLDSNNQANLTDITDEVGRLKNIGRFLSIWNAATGLPTTNPTTGTTYTYNTGDYYRVGTVSATTNYKPSGSSYTKDVPSTTVETEAVETGWVYYYDGSQWVAQSSGGSVANALNYLTTAPTSANTNGIKHVVLDSEPSAYYSGYMYFITE